MGITFKLPGYLQQFSGGRSAVKLASAPASVQAALEELFAQAPGVRDRVLTERGEVRPHVNIFVGDESIRYTGGLKTAVGEGAVITILPAVSGGAAVTLL